MAFKDIHKLRKIAVVEKEIINADYLVIGKDAFAISTYLNLKKEHSKDSVRLLSADTILKSDIFPKGPSTIRGESNLSLFKENFANLSFVEKKENSLFYKDMTWKNFGGRSKSEALRYDEEFFTSGRIEINYKDAFSELDLSDEFINEINEDAYQVKIKSIARTESGFVVECINGTEFHCKEIYFSYSPYQYYEFYAEKKELSDSFIQFCESTKTASALFVKFVFEKPLSDIEETLFIPLSYTHDWGHFVGEFKTNNEGKQEIEFIHYIDHQTMSEEDASRVIRLLKKSMEKIFDNFSKIKSQDFISLEQDLACLKIDDSLYETVEASHIKDIEGLKFIGINSPLGTSHSKNRINADSSIPISGILRGLFSDSLHLNKSSEVMLTKE